MNFVLDQLNPKMRAQAEKKIAELSAFRQIRRHAISDRHPTSWGVAEGLIEKPKAVEAPSIPPVPDERKGVRVKDRKPRRSYKSMVGTKQEKQAVRRGSDLERELDFQIKVAGIPPAIKEFKFLPLRKFRLDYAWPEQKRGIEVQGMAHRIKERFEADIEKRALAKLSGWSVLEVSGKKIRDGTAIKWIEEFLQVVPRGTL